VDFVVYSSVQCAAIAAFPGLLDCFRWACRIHQNPHDAFVSGLKEILFEIRVPKAPFYVWLSIDDYMTFAQRMLDKVGIVVAPGFWFGEYGERHMRFSLTRVVERTEDAVERMQQAGIDG